MQFNILALTVAAMASVAVATETVTVYACPSATGLSPGYAAPTGTSGSSSGESTYPAGAASPSGAASSTGTVTAPTSTSSPIAYAGAAGHTQVSAFGMVVAGAVALFI